MDLYFREVWKKVYFRRDSNINFPAHIHDNIELVYVFQGGGNAFCDGKEYTLKPGSVFVVFPEQLHSFSGCRDGEYILLVISPSRLLYQEAFFRSSIPACAQAEGSPILANLLTDALAAFNAKQDPTVIYGYLTAFFGSLFQNMTFHHSTELTGTVYQILQYCSQHYKEPLTLRDLCDVLHISQSHVSHIFSSRLKISFPNYLNALRLNSAIPLLQETGRNMAEVANLAGFPTIRTFNRVFGKQYGCTPSEYRSRYGKKA